MINSLTRINELARKEREEGLTKVNGSSRSLCVKITYVKYVDKFVTVFQE